MKKKSNQVRGAHARVEDPSERQPRSYQDSQRVPQRSFTAQRNTYSQGAFRNVPQSGQFNTAAFDSIPSKKNKSKAWKVVFVIAVVVLICSVVALGAIVYQYWAQQKAYSDLETHVSLSDNSNVSLADLSVDWDALENINPDVVAWIYIPGTPVNYPVVKGNDNEEYLHKAFDGSTGWLASAGTVFLDVNNQADLSDRNNALYGHNMNDGSMFAALAQWENEDEFNAHRDIYLLTPKGNYRLKSFAVVATTGSDAIVQTGFGTEADYFNYIQDKFNRSVVEQKGTILSASDIKQSLLLSTCEYTKTDGRAVIFAAVVETTVTNDPYVSSTTEGTTGINQEELSIVAEQYREAA